MSPRWGIILLLLATACRTRDGHQPAEGYEPGTFGYDLAFLSKHDKTVIELAAPEEQAMLIVSPRFQGRVMTSSSSGLEGKSYGWINYDLIASHTWKAQFNPVGGEERFWLGPEGGQYSLYFAPGDSFDIKNWQVPPIIDTVSYSVKQQSEAYALFEADAQLQNRTGTLFNIRITRGIELLNRTQTEAALGIDLHQDIKYVAYRTSNTIVNISETAWKKETGLISVWLLGMFTPSPATTVIIPFLPGGKARINTDYFGDIPADRLEIRDSVVLFRCDGKYRSKIGLPPDISSPYAGSYDSERKILTIIRFDIDKEGDYVNSKWEIQEKPYSGDVLNSYNDGPLADGSQLGPFYELESSSSTRPLQSAETLTHTQVTCHLEGDESILRDVARTLLSIDIKELIQNK
jgi:hypothetical protein